VPFALSHRSSVASSLPFLEKTRSVLFSITHTSTVRILASEPRLVPSRARRSARPNRFFDVSGFSAPIEFTAVLSPLAASCCECHGVDCGSVPRSCERARRLLPTAAAGAPPLRVRCVGLRSFDRQRQRSAGHTQLDQGVPLPLPSTPLLCQCSTTKAATSSCRDQIDCTTGRLLLPPLQRPSNQSSALPLPARSSAAAALAATSTLLVTSSRLSLTDRATPRHCTTALHTRVDRSETLVQSAHFV
jgi:hypothetical protein